MRQGHGTLKCRHALHGHTLLDCSCCKLHAAVQRHQEGGARRKGKDDAQAILWDALVLIAQAIQQPLPGATAQLAHDFSHLQGKKKQ